MPAESEVRALFALMLLTNSRRRSRVGEHGQPVSARRSGPQPLGRRRDPRLASPSSTRRPATPSPGATSSRPRSPPNMRWRSPRRATNWPRIARLYDTLMRIAPSPVVELNRLVAVSMADGPEVAFTGLAALAEPLDEVLVLPRHPCRDAAAPRAAGDALDAYRRAIELEQNGVQRRSCREPRRVAGERWFCGRPVGHSSRFHP